MIKRQPNLNSGSGRPSGNIKAEHEKHKKAQLHDSSIFPFCCIEDFSKSSIASARFI